MQGNWEPKNDAIYPLVPQSTNLEAKSLDTDISLNLTKWG